MRKTAVIRLRKRLFPAGAAIALAVAYTMGVILVPEEGGLRGAFSPFAYGALVLGILVWGVRGVMLVVVFGVTLGILSLTEHRAGAGWADAGQVVAFLVVAVGVVSLRDRVASAKTAQQESERKYRDIVEKSLAGFFVYRGRKVLYANSRIQQLVGLDPEEARDADFWGFVGEEEKAKVEVRLAQREREGITDHHYECRLVRTDGQSIWADIVSSSIDYEGAPAVMVSVYDISERKQIEDKRRELSRLAMRQEEQLVHSTRLAEMGEMAAGIAHELNQPLTGIKNYAKNAVYMVSEGSGDLEEVKGNLQLISGQVDRASRIIGQMRELARRSERELAVIDINQKLRETVEFVAPQLQLSGVDVTLSVDEGLPKVMGDGVRIEQVFLNLLTNARQAMEDSAQRRLTVSTRRDVNEQRPVVIEIADTGKGFPPESAAKLFTPFYTTKQTRHGTGLGLSISLSIVKDHAGTIEATGAQGKGATFTVRFPAALLGEEEDGTATEERGECA